MTWLLKILQGTNAGAEIELPEGVVTRIGRSLDCDVMLQDNRMAEEAVALDIQNGAMVLTPLAAGCRIGMRHLAQNRPESLPPYTPFLIGSTVCCCGDANSEWPELDLSPLFAVPETAVASVPEESPAESAEPAGPTEEELEAARRAEELAEQKKSRRRKVLHFLCWLIFLMIFLALALYAAHWVWQTTIPEADDSVEYNERNQKTFLELVKGKGFTLGQIDPANNGPYRVTGNFEKAADRKRFVATALRAYPNCILDLSDDETLKAAVASALTGLTEEGVEVVSAKNRTVRIQGMMDNFSDWTTARAALLKEVRHLQTLEENVILADEMCKRFQNALQAAGLNSLTVRSGKRQFIFAGNVPTNQKGTLLAILDECSKYVPENVSVLHAVRWKDEATGITYGAPSKPASVASSAPGAPAGIDLPGEIPPLPLPISGIMLSPMKCLVLADGSRCLEGGTTRGCTVLEIREDSAVIRFNGEEYTWRP